MHSETKLNKSKKLHTIQLSHNSAIQRAQQSQHSATILFLVAVVLKRKYLYTLCRRIDEDEMKSKYKGAFKPALVRRERNASRSFVAYMDNLISKNPLYNSHEGGWRR